MKKRKKAFTLLELIITLSITIIVLGVIYTFFISNTKTLITTEINTDLQEESQKIQSELLKYGSEATKISRINESDLKEDNKMFYKDILNDIGKIDVNEIVFNVQGDKYKFQFDEASKTLYLTKNSEESKVLSNNVIDFKIRPLDYRMNSEGSFYEANGLEFSLILNAKKGYADISIPLSTIVKFRNR
jgi:type II secretory pathway pseudopilin PulG